MKFYVDQTFLSVENMGSVAESINGGESENADSRLVGHLPHSLREFWEHVTEKGLGSLLRQMRKGPTEGWRLN